MSPSSFIPFCEFGGNMSALGVKIDQFDVPVCNSFQAKILNDQLCYEVDPNFYVKSVVTKSDLKLGLTLLLDYNEDRQTSFVEDSNISFTESVGITKNIVRRSEDLASIYIHSIGQKYSIISPSSQF